MTDDTKPTKAAEKSTPRAKSAGATGATGASGATGATGPVDRNRATPVMETAEVQRGLEAKRAKTVQEAGAEPGTTASTGTRSTQAQETDNPWDRIYGPEDHPPVAETGDVEVPDKGYIGTQPGDEDFGRA